MSDSEHGTPGPDGTGPADDSGRPLPPPAFPPGTRRHQMRRSQGGEGPQAAMDGAFISPDDPMPDRDGRPATATADPEGGDDDVVVTGIGNDAHLDPEELKASGDPHVMELTERVTKLAQALRQKGEAGLRAHPEMDRFDATLRSYCVGYLAGRRAADEG